VLRLLEDDAVGIAERSRLGTSPLARFGTSPSDPRVRGDE
jgi:hypothetical protein